MKHPDSDTPADPGRQAPHPTGVVERFLHHQRAMYEGGDIAAVSGMLAEDVVWHVPGHSPIAGTYRGRAAVLRYFAIRRNLAGGSIVITKHGDLIGPDVQIQLADGHATLGGVECDWRTAGIYRVADGKLAEAWLVPLDQAHFDRCWGTTREAPFEHTHRARPQECAARGPIGHPRLLEFFEAAFVECWRARFGGVDGSIGPGRRLAVATMDVDYLGQVVADDDIRIEVTLDQITSASIQVHFEAFVADRHVARAGARYDCVEAATGAATPLPGAIRCDITPARRRLA